MPSNAESALLPGDEALLDLLRRAAESVGFGIVVTLIDEAPFRSLHVNQRAQEILGRTLEELNADGGALAAAAPEARPALLERKERRSRGEPVPDLFETVVIRPNGERVPIQVALSQATIAGRSTNVSFIFDLSLQRRAESALRESEERFRTVVQNAPDGVAILRGPSILYLNERAGRLLGLPSAEAGIGRRISEFLHPEDVESAERRIRALLETGRTTEPHEYRSRSAEGRELTVEISSIPIELHGQRAVLAFARDVTERKAIQARLAQAERLSALGVLSAGVAHEINNPLAYVVLNLEFLERELLKPAGVRPEALLERVRQARHGAERVAAIARDLKTFARSDGSPRGAVRIEPVLESALKVAHGEMTARARVVRRYVEVPPIEGNAARLEQVFLNLFLNAAQAIPEGEPEKHEISVELDGDGETVRVAVRDDGSGMTPEIEARIFDPFFTTKPPGVGTGLGLPICQSILRAHGGELEVQSRAGNGSTFTVVLPRWAGEKRSEPVSREQAPLPLARGRVLVIDDEVAVGRTLCLVLEPEYEVTVTTSAQEALAELRAAQRGSGFDVILCDLVMPGMTGRDLYEVVKRELSGLESRFVFMSGGYSSSPADELALSPHTLFEKPFDLEQVRRTLREMTGS